MCLSSFFQFPLFVITCIESLETTNVTTSKPHDMLSAAGKPSPPLILLLGCLLLVLSLIASGASAWPIPHHRHVKPWAVWHRTTHVRRDISIPITTGAELPDMPASRTGYWAVDDVTPDFASDTLLAPADRISSPPRLPRDRFARAYECWRGGKLWSCVMQVLKAADEVGSSSP
jgi:hypothetical protein